MRQLILKLAVIAVLTAALTGCDTTPAVSPSPPLSTPAASVPPSTFVPVGIKIGDIAPDITLPDADGQPVTLGRFKGRPMLVNVWSFT